jgi:hypoxanthine phosphoribosyltransferase
MVEPINCRFVSFQEIYDMSKKLADKVAASGYNPDVLVAIARSGFVPGRLMSDFLGNSCLYSLKVEHWLDTTAQHTKDATIPQRTPLPIKGKRVLVIDDIVDTGKSAKQAMQYCRDLGATDVKIAVMVYLANSELEPDFYSIKQVEWVWLSWFWNKYEDLRNLSLKLFDNDKNKILALKDIRAGLKKYFKLDVTPAEVEQVMRTAARIGKVAFPDAEHVRLA